MFGGGNSIQLARVFGIRIGVEPSWFLVLFLIIYLLTGYYTDVGFGDQTAFILAVVSALAFFLSVLLHELGHAVVALRSGIGIAGIDLWMFGGVAKMNRDSNSAGEEFRVAAAGPFVTLLIAAVCYGIGSVISGGGAAADAIQFDAVAGEETLAVLGYLTSINLLLLVFNLIPGFPLDGGRIARAIAWKVTGDRTRATRFAARLGRGFAFLMIAGGVLIVLASPGNLITGVWLGFVGVFLGQAARQAEAQTEVTSRIEGLRVADVMDDEPVGIPASSTIERALDEFFLRYRYPWFPVVDDAGRFTGLVTEESVNAVLESERNTRTVDSVMAPDMPGSADGGLRVGLDEPLETLLGREVLQRLGAIVAVDPEGRLRGVVTVDQIRRALQPVRS
jgi:Zn-dependent protease